MLGMFYEVGVTLEMMSDASLTFPQNGPLHLGNDNSMFTNNQSWDRVADFIWLDQPV